MNRRYGDEDFQSDPVLMTGVLGSSLPKFTSVCVGFSPCGDAMLACRDGRTCYRWGCWENCLSPKREGALADSTCDCITFPQRVDLGVSANARMCDIRRSLRVFRSLRSSLNRQHAVVVFESGDIVEYFGDGNVKRHEPASLVKKRSVYEGFESESFIEARVDNASALKVTDAAVSFNLCVFSLQLLLLIRTRCRLMRWLRLPGPALCSNGAGDGMSLMTLAV